jgi:hypothetical protein
LVETYEKPALSTAVKTGWLAAGSPVKKDFRMIA